MTRRSRDLPVRAAAGDQAQHLDLPLGQARPARARAAGASRRPAAASTQATASAIQPAPPPRARGPLRRPASAGRCGRSAVSAANTSAAAEQPGLARLRLGRERAVVPGAVEALVVRGRRLDEGRERAAAGEDALRVVGVEPHPLPLRGRERARLVPDPVLDGRRGRGRGRAPRAAGPRTRPSSSPAWRPASAASAATRARVAADPRRLEVGEVGEGGQDRRRARPAGRWPPARARAPARPPTRRRRRARRGRRGPTRSNASTTAGS